MILHLRAAIQQLYAAGLAEFVAVRSALVAEARQAGEKDLAEQVGALRKPTVAAWALNHFVREHPDELDAFEDFAELLREAQRTLDAEQLRLLSRERARRVEALARAVEAAARGAGQPISGTVGQDIRETLTALIAAEGAAEAVRTGALVKPLRYSGLGDVDIDGAAAVTPTHLRVIEGGGAPDTTGRRDRAGRETGEQADGQTGKQEDDEADVERRRAEQEARRAEEHARWVRERARLAAVLDRAEKARAEADHKLEVGQARLEEVDAGVADLERQLASARDRRDKATDALARLSGIRQEKTEAEAAARVALQTHDAGEPG